MTTYDIHPDGHVSTQDMQPDLDTVQQVEREDSHVIPVKICEPVETRELPTGRTSPRTEIVNLTGNIAVKLLSADPRRKRATIIAKTNDIRVGISQTAAQLKGVWVPGSQQLPVLSTGEFWAVGTVDATEVSIFEEYWA